MIKVMPINEEEKPSLKDMDLLLEVFFGFFDKNGDGVISICELKQTMEDMGEKPRSGHECNLIAFCKGITDLTGRQIQAG